MESRFKIILMLVITLNILIIGYFYTLINVTPSPQLLFEKTTHAHYMRKAQSIDQRSILFIGSSSIQGLNVSQITHDGINLGIGGERILGLIDRVQEYNQLPQSRLIVIAAGFNDLCRSNTSTMSKQFNLLIQNLSNIPVIISALQPATNLKVCDGLANKIIQFNQYLQDTCHTIQQCYFVDLPKILANQNKPVFEADAIHLSKFGYQLWQAELASKIKQALNTIQKRNSIL